MPGPFRTTVNFPTSSDVFSTRQDGVDAINAEAFNSLASSLTSVQTALTSTSTNLTIGNLKLSDGTVSAPSLAFASAGNTNTGLYLFNTDTLGFASNGVSSGTLSSTGAWTLGPSTGSGLTHIVRSNGQTVLELRPTDTVATTRSILSWFNGAGTAIGQILTGTNGVDFQINQNEASGNIVFRNASAQVNGQVSNAGAWTFPIATTHTFGASAGASPTTLTLDAATNVTRNITIQGAGTTRGGLRATGANLFYVFSQGTDLNFSADNLTTTHLSCSNASGTWTFFNSSGNTIVLSKSTTAPSILWQSTVGNSFSIDNNIGTLRVLDNAGTSVLAQTTQAGAWTFGPSTTPLAGIKHTVQGSLYAKDSSLGEYFVADSFQKSAVAPSTIALASIQSTVQGSTSWRVTLTQVTRIQGINNYSQVFEAIYTQTAGGALTETILHNIGSTVGAGSVTTTLQNNPSKVTFNGNGNGAANYAAAVTITVQGVSMDGAAAMQPVTYTRL